jgi:hypothetical protein
MLTPARINLLIWTSLAATLLLPLLTSGAEVHRTLIETIDHCPEWSCDFVRHYLPQAARFAAGEPGIAQGYLYPPLLGLLLIPLSALPPTTALAAWAVVQILSIIALILVGAWAGRAHPRPLLAATVLVLTATGVWHSWKWGQISIGLNALILAGVLSSRWRAGLALGLATAIKGYPALLFPLLLVRRQWTAAAAMAASAAVLGLLLPVILIGAGPTLSFYAGIRAESARITAASASGGGQSLAAALGRYFLDAGTVIGHELRSGALIVGLHPDLVPLLVVTVGGGLVLLTVRRWAHFDAQLRSIWSVCLLCVLLPPGWVHYFSFLPVIHLMLWARLRSAKLLGVLWLAITLDRLPIALMGSVENVWFYWVMWGGMFVAAALTMGICLWESRAQAPAVVA